MTSALVLIAIIMISVALAVNGFKQRRANPRLPRRFDELTCTKHVIVKSLLPGGPEHMQWLYGRHRTRGNACDGGKHNRKGGWW
jgi:hypothetical protein